MWIFLVCENLSYPKISDKLGHVSHRYGQKGQKWIQKKMSHSIWTWSSVKHMISGFTNLPVLIISITWLFSEQVCERLMANALS